VDAERALGSYLTDEPDDPIALSWLALVMAGLEKAVDATRHAERAVRVAPDLPLAWYAFGHVWRCRGQLPKAEEAAREAIRLDPEDPDALGLLAQIQVDRKQWRDALETAESGLRVDPEDDTCTNLKAVALRGLGRKAEAADVLEGQLARTPEDATTHANLGWTALDRGDYERAHEHFREALRLEPDSEAARSGIIEALKARHWFFRPVLRYFLWMGKLQAKWQVAILVGGWLVYRAAAGMARSEAPGAFLLWVVVGAYLLFVVLSWFANPIMHGLLAFHPFGRLALNRREKTQGWLVSGLLCLGFGLGVVGLVQSGVLVIAGLAVVILCLPLSLVFDLAWPKARRGMLAYTGAMALLGAWWVASAHSTAALVAWLRPIGAQIKAQAAERELIESERKRLVEREAGGARGAAFEAELKEFKARLDEFEQRNEALAQGIDERDLDETLEAVKSKASVRDSIGLTYAILGFWVSQFVAVGLARAASRS